MQEFARGVYGKLYADDSGYVYKVFDTEEKNNEPGWIREIVALNNLNHPNIVHPKYIGVNFAPDTITNIGPNLYIKMPRYSQIIKIQNSLCDADIFQCLLDLFNGLAYMHSHLIMHRDIKEANLLYEPSKIPGRQIKKLLICDFSLARYTINTSDIKNFNYLTPETITLTHRPPEVFQAQMLYKKEGLKKSKIEYNELVDVWSVGIVMFFLLTGIQLYYAIFVYGKDDAEFIEFISKIPELSHIKVGQKITVEDSEKIFTYLLLSDSATLCIKRWLYKYMNKNLKHIDFFKQIMFECLADVDKRSSASELANKISRYIVKNDLVSEINDSGQLGMISEKKIHADHRIISAINPIIQESLNKINSFEVRALILNKMSIILSKVCENLKKDINQISIKYVFAAAHIVEIVFLYANIFTNSSINYIELNKYINQIFNETKFLEGLF